MTHGFIVIELDDTLPHRCLAVPDGRGFVPAAAYTVLAGIEDEAIVGDPTVRHIMDVSSRLGNEPRPIDYMYAYARPASDQQKRTIAGRMNMEEHQLMYALDGLRRAPGVLAVAPATKPLVTARFRPFVYPGRHTEEFLATLYGGIGPDPDARRRLLIERFMNKYKPTSFDA